VTQVIATRYRFIERYRVAELGPKNWGYVINNGIVQESGGGRGAGREMTDGEGERGTPMEYRLSATGACPRGSGSEHECMSSWISAIQHKCMILELNHRTHPTDTNGCALMGAALGVLRSTLDRLAGVLK
jgi:hypothetical protein